MRIRKTPYTAHTPIANSATAIGRRSATRQAPRFDTTRSMLCTSTDCTNTTNTDKPLTPKRSAACAMTGVS